VLPSLTDQLDAELRGLEEMGRLRECLPFSGPSRAAPTLADATPLLSFCSNDYLGLASHPALAAAAAASALRTGFGASASRLVTGDFPEHRALETALAEHVALPAALLFPTGYQANLGLIPALAGRGDLVLSDAANHASLIDGCRLSRAEVLPYPHLDPAAVDAALRAAGTRHRRRLIVTESVFSMDGDTAPLADLAALAERHQAVLVVDEAHALGVLGPGGGGLCRDIGVVPDALVGTLGKAFGAAGGFVAGSAALVRLLVNRARTFVFTTALPPPVAAAAQAGLAIASSGEGDRRRSLLTGALQDLRASLPPRHRTPGLGPIVPVILGSDRAATSASGRLREQGIFVQAIRPPTVPEGTARLRLTLSAAHTPSDLRALFDALRTTLSRT
jgi:8-amino-7-oxononanoate synthase